MDQPSEASSSHASRADWEQNHKACEITATEWEEQRGTFTQLYLGDLKLTEVRRIMAEEHGFYANEAQCKKKIKKWDLGKSLSKEVVARMLLIRDKRELIEGKPTSFVYRGKPVGEDKLGRSRKRLRLGHASEEELNSVAATPLHVNYFTPSPKIYGPGTPDGHGCQEDAGANLTGAPPSFEPVVDAGSVSESRDQGILGHRLRDIYKGNEFVGGPAIRLEQRDETPTVDMNQSRRVTGSEIKQSLSDIQWKDPGRGDVSTIGSWIRNDIVLSGGSVFSFDSRSLHSSSSRLEQNIDLSCCGTPLRSTQELFEHYEGHHAQQKEQTIQATTAQMGGLGPDAEMTGVWVPLEVPYRLREAVGFEIRPLEHEREVVRHISRIDWLEMSVIKLMEELGEAQVRDEQLLGEEPWFKVPTADGVFTKDEEIMLSGLIKAVRLK